MRRDVIIGVSVAIFAGFGITKLAAVLGVSSTAAGFAIIPVLIGLVSWQVHRAQGYPPVDRARKT
jgi:hypothetical protein